MSSMPYEPRARDLVNGELDYMGKFMPAESRSHDLTAGNLDKPLSPRRGIYSRIIAKLIKGLH